LYFIIIALALALDQGSKFLVRSNMELNTSIPLIDGLLQLTYVQNTGAAFSLFQGQRLLLTIIQTVVIAVLLVYLFRRRKKDSPLLLTSLSLIVSGGLGNLMDRVMQGYVVDFIELPHWPVFNAADIMVCVGCGLLAICVIFFDRIRNRG